MTIDHNALAAAVEEKSTVDAPKAANDVSENAPSGATEKHDTEEALPAASEVEPVTVLSKVREILREKTRFKPEDVQPVDEKNLQQPIRVRVIHELLARVEDRTINGFFQRKETDNETFSPYSDAKKECPERLRLGSSKLRSFLALPETSYSALAAGCLLPHARSHWHLDTCGTCGSVGKVTCGTCYGKKQVTCHSCNGGMYVSHNACNGSGYTNCMTCNGSGQQSTINGQSGRLEYRTCTGIGCRYGKVFCGGCNGTGKIRCSVCNVTGKITCRTCSGRGDLTCKHCQGSCKVGDAACVDVMSTLSYELILPKDADSAAPAIGGKEGPHGVAALTENGISLETVTEDEPNAPKKVTADYQGVLEIAHLAAACNGKEYHLTAYGTDLRWLTMDGIVEDLLRGDLAALQNALIEAGDEDFYASRLDHVLPALKHVAASELNSELMTSVLEGISSDSDAPAHCDSVVSADYAKQVKAGTLGSLRVIHTRLGLEFWWKVSAAAGLAGILVWLFSTNWGAAIAGLAAATAGWHFFKRKVKAVLSDALGGSSHAQRAMDIATKGKRNRVAMGIVIVPAVLLTIGMFFGLPRHGPWGGPSKTDISVSAAIIASRPISAKPSCCTATRTFRSSQKKPYYTAT